MSSLAAALTRAASRLRPVWWLLVPIVVAAAYASSPSFGFLGDARFLLEHNRLLEGPLWPQLTHDYFWSSSGNTIPYWRPFTKGSWWLEHRLGAAASGHHLVQVAWHLVGCGAAMALARALGATRAGAAVSCLLFGLGAVAVEPVCLLMARSDVVACAASGIALWAWHRHAERGAWRWLALHAVAVGVALASKEVAVVIAPAVVVWAVARRRWKGLDGRRAVIATLPALGVTAVALLLRAAALHGRGGAGIALDPLRIFVGGGRYIQGLLPLRLVTGLRNVSRREALCPPALLGAGLAWSGVAAIALAMLRRRDADGLGLLTWAAGTLAPVLLVADMNVPDVMGKFALADRWALPASLVVAVLTGARLLPAIPRRARRLAFAAVAVWALLSVLAANLPGGSHSYYHSEFSLLAKEDADFDSTPPRFRTLEDTCRRIDRGVVRLVLRGRWPQVLEQSARTRGCPPDLLRDFNRLSALVELERWEAADALSAGLLERSGADTRHLPMLHHLRARVLAAKGRWKRALRHLRKALALGLRSCRLARDLAAALRHNGRLSAADALRTSAPLCWKESMIGTTY